MSAIDDLNAEILRTQQQLDALIIRRDRFQQTLDYLETQRPAGIPLTWKPHFRGLRPDPVTIFAWFDPAKFGETLNAR